MREQRFIGFRQRRYWIEEAGLSLSQGVHGTANFVEAFRPRIPRGQVFIADRPALEIMRIAPLQHHSVEARRSASSVPDEGNERVSRNSILIRLRIAAGSH